MDIWSVERYVGAGHSIDELASMLEQAGLRCTDMLPLVISADPATTLGSAARLATIASATGARQREGR